MLLSVTSRKGFSLLELLVTCSILLVLFVVLAQTLWWSGNIWTGGRTRSENRRMVRAAQDSIRKELRAAVLPVDRQTPSGRGDLQFVINPSSVPAQYKNADAIFWQAPIATDVSEGAFAEIGYFVRWSGNRAALCRLFLNPSESRTLLSTTDVLQRTYQHPGDWVNEDVLKAAAPADEAHGYQGLFAENVIGFWVRPLNAGGAVSYNVGTAGFDSNINFDGRAAPVLPSFVEISYVVIDSGMANRLAERSDASSLIASIQSLAASAKTNDASVSPADRFLENLKGESNLQFLLKGASQYQMIVDLR